MGLGKTTIKDEPRVIPTKLVSSSILDLSHENLSTTKNDQIPISRDHDQGLASNPTAAIATLTYRLDRIHAYLHGEDIDLLKAIKQVPKDVSSASEVDQEKLLKTFEITRIQLNSSRCQQLRKSPEFRESLINFAGLITSYKEDISATTSSRVSTDLLRASLLSTVNDLVNAIGKQEIFAEPKAVSISTANIRILNQLPINTPDIKVSAKPIEISPEEEKLISAITTELQVDQSEQRRVTMSNSDPVVTGYVTKEIGDNLSRYLPALEGQVPVDTAGNLVTLTGFTKAIDRHSNNRVLQTENTKEETLPVKFPQSGGHEINVAVQSDGRFIVPQKHRVLALHPVGGAPEGIDTYLVQQDLAGTYRLVTSGNTALPSRINCEIARLYNDGRTPLTEETEQKITALKSVFKKGFSVETQDIIERALLIEDRKERATYVVSRLKSSEWIYTKDVEFKNITEQAGDKLLTLLGGMKAGHCQYLSYFVSTVLTAAEVPCIYISGDVATRNNDQVEFQQPGHAQIRVLLAEGSAIIDPTCWAQDKKFDLENLSSESASLLAKINTLDNESINKLGEAISRECFTANPGGSSAGHNIDEDIVGSGQAIEITSLDRLAIRKRLNTVVKDYQDSGTVSGLINYIDNKFNHSLLERLIQTNQDVDGKTLTAEGLLLIDCLEAGIQDEKVEYTDRLKLLRIVQHLSHTKFSDTINAEFETRLVQVANHGEITLKPHLIEESTLIRNSSLHNLKEYNEFRHITQDRRFSFSTSDNYDRNSTFAKHLQVAINNPELLAVVKAAQLAVLTGKITSKNNPEKLEDKIYEVLSSTNELYGILENGIHSNKMDTRIAIRYQNELLDAVENFFSENHLPPYQLFINVGDHRSPFGRIDYTNHLRSGLSQRTYFKEVLANDGTIKITSEVKTLLEKEALSLMQKKMAGGLAYCLEIKKTYLEFNLNDIKDQVSELLLESFVARGAPLVNFPRPENYLSNFLVCHDKSIKKEITACISEFIDNGLFDSSLDKFEGVWLKLNEGQAVPESQLQEKLFRNGTIVRGTDYHRLIIDNSIDGKDKSLLSISNFAGVMMHYYPEEFSKMLAPDQALYFDYFKDLDFHNNATEELENWRSRDLESFQAFGKELANFVSGNNEAAKLSFASLRNQTEQILREEIINFDLKAMDAERALSTLFLKLNQDDFEKCLASIATGNQDSTQQVIDANFDATLSNSVDCRVLQYIAIRQATGHILETPCQRIRTNKAKLTPQQLVELATLPDNQKASYAIFSIPNPAAVNDTPLANSDRQSSSSGGLPNTMSNSKQINSVLKVDTISPTRSSMGGSEIVGSREYQPGDNVRDLNYKLMARNPDKAWVKAYGNDSSPENYRSSKVHLDLEFLVNDPKAKGDLVIATLVREVRKKESVDFKMFYRGYELPTSYESLSLQRMFKDPRDPSSFQSGVAKIRHEFAEAIILIKEIDREESKRSVERQNAFQASNITEEFSSRTSDPRKTKVIAFCAAKNRTKSHQIYQEWAKSTGCIIDLNSV